MTSLYENLISVAKKTNDYYFDYISTLDDTCDESKNLISQLKKEIASNIISINYYEKLVERRRG